MPTQLMAWQQAIMTALQSFTANVFSVIPNILAAIVVLFVGMFLSGLLGRLTHKLVDYTRLDTFLDMAVGFAKLRERGLKLSASVLFGCRGSRRDRSWCPSLFSSFF